jgi:hypothetical protein
MKAGLTGYIPGNYLAECDRCGLTYRKSQLYTEYSGLWVCRECYDTEPVYPQTRPDRIAVYKARPRQETIAKRQYYNHITIFQNIFPDPFISPTNDGLWSGGINSEQHVKAEYYSKKLDNVNVDITVSGFEIGQIYRIRCSTWTPDTASIQIDGEDIGIFTVPATQMWITESVYHTAISESAVFTFVGSANTNYYDDIHVQKYETVEIFISASDIIENKSISDVTTDYTVEGAVIDFFSFYEDDDFNASGFGTEDDPDTGGGFVSGTE